MGLKAKAGPKPKAPTKLAAEWRERIGVGLLLNLLEAHAAGRIRMTATRIRSAEILLRKCLPDLASLEHKGELTETVRYYAEMPKQDDTADEWIKGNPPKPQPTTH